MLKTMLVVIYAKMLHRSFIPTISKLFFLFTYCTGIFVNFYTGLICVIEIIKAILRYFHWIIFKQMDIISKIETIMFTENYV